MPNEVCSIVSVANYTEMTSKISSKMTDEERKKLGAKLDNELDEFIEGLEKRSYTEGWPEDKWKEVVC